MTQYSFPHNDVDDDRLYDAFDFKRFFKAFLKTGVVMSFGKGLLIESAQNGMNIQVNNGAGVIEGGSHINDAVIAIKVDVASSVQDRKDSVVLRWDDDIRDSYILYKPNDTSVIRNATIFELQLAIIDVPRNATQIVNANITDMRGNSTVCGWSTPFDNINVDGMIQQYDDAILTWFEGMKDQLSEDAAINLQNQINTSLRSKGAVTIGADIHTITDPGFYVLPVGSYTNSHYATFTKKCHLEVLQDGAGNIKQVITPFEELAPIYDQYDGTTWIGWRGYI